MQGSVARVLLGGGQWSRFLVSREGDLKAERRGELRKVFGITPSYRLAAAGCLPEETTRKSHLLWLSGGNDNNRC